ncbi:DEAD/DEAH box helicase (plasmid) [Deinococcus sp. PESE-38]
MLGGWFERRAEKDVVVKMNTGAGKTVVGLLLLKSCLNEDFGPAAYFTPDNYLVRQVLAEAKAMGIDATDDPTSGDFLRGRSILVANIAKLINGKSIFGVGMQESLIELGSLLIDDAHACLASSEGQFTIKLRPSHSVYKALFSLLREDLHHQSPVGVLDLEAGKLNRDLLVPFTAWQSHIDQIRAVLHAHAEDDALKFVWPLLAEDLLVAQATFGRRGLEIEMRSLPVDRIPSFSRARRRIFMTATLPDDSLLVRDFDVAQGAVERPITPQRASDLGERMILAPQELNTQLRDTDVKTIATELAQKYNVVVIVPSHQRASFWSDVAVQTLDRKTLEAGVNALRAGHVGLVVLVNRYDGVDLPDDACRVLIIDGLPNAMSQLESVDASSVGDNFSLASSQTEKTNSQPHQA